MRIYRTNGLPVKRLVESFTGKNRSTAVKVLRPKVKIDLFLVKRGPMKDFKRSLNTSSHPITKRFLLIFSRDIQNDDEKPQLYG